MSRLKTKICKRALGILLIVWGSGIFLNGYVGLGEPVHAQGAQESTQTSNITDANTDTASTASLDTMGIRQILNIILKVIYLLIRPLLVLAGLALDNTLVYASVFHLDAPLRKFRNMMKNFANFALWFIVLFTIIKSILTNSGEWTMKDENTPLGVIKATLIAGILIQASRFLLAALVDVSTVATYAVGGLPLSVLKDTEIGKQKILTVSSSIDLNKFDLLNEDGNSFKVRYSTNYRSGDKVIPVKFSPCKIQTWYVVGKEFPDEKFRNSDVFWTWQSACVLYGNQIVIYNEFPNLIWETNKTRYTNQLNRILDSQPDRKPWEACGFVIRLLWRSQDLWDCAQGLQTVHEDYIAQYPDATDDMAAITDNPPQNLNFSTLWIEWWSDRFNSGNVMAMTMDNIIKGSKGFVGPLVTMYASLLHFAQLTDSQVTSIWETSGVFIIKSLVAIALFFPLIALALVMIARIGILRLYIVASPFLVIKATFKNLIPKMGKLDDYLDFKAVMGIVFAPVITVAALSLSLIFMTALVQWFKTSDINDNLYATLGTTKVQTAEGLDAVNYEGIAEVEFTKLPRSEGLDRFSWMIVNFFAIGLMRMIFFAAIRANAIGAKIGKSVQEFWSNVFQTLPILPLGPEGRGVGIGSAATVSWWLPQEYAKKMQTEQQTTLVNQWMGENETGTGTGTGTENKLTADQINKVIENIKNASNVTTAETGIETYLKWENITAWAGTTFNNNAAEFYTSINAVESAADRTKILANMPTSLKDIYNAAAKTDIDTGITNKIKSSDTESIVQGYVNDKDNKKSLDNYFATNPVTENTITLATADDTEVTITVTRDPTNGNTYKATAPTKKTTTK